MKDYDVFLDKCLAECDNGAQTKTFDVQLIQRIAKDIYLKSNESYFDIALLDRGDKDIYLNNLIRECDIFVKTFMYKEYFDTAEKLVLDSCIKLYNLEKFLIQDQPAKIGLIQHIDSMLELCYSKVNSSIFLEQSMGLNVGQEAAPEDLCLAMQNSLDAITKYMFMYYAIDPVTWEDLDSLELRWEEWDKKSWQDISYKITDIGASVALENSLENPVAHKHFDKLENKLLVESKVEQVIKESFSGGKVMIEPSFVIDILILSYFVWIKNKINLSTIINDFVLVYPFRQDLKLEIKESVDKTNMRSYLSSASKFFLMTNLSDIKTVYEIFLASLDLEESAQLVAIKNESYSSQEIGVASDIFVDMQRYGHHYDYDESSLDKMDGILLYDLDYFTYKYRTWSELDSLALSWGDLESMSWNELSYKKFKEG